jgi:hypothetical protein
MSDQLTESRDQLVAALEAAGLDVLETPAARSWHAPVAIVAGGIPWLEPADVGPPGAYWAAWTVELVAGRADQRATVEQLAGMALAALDALRALPSWRLPRVGPPRSMEIDGATYSVAQLTTAELLLPPMCR